MTIPRGAASAARTIIYLTRWIRVLPLAASARRAALNQSAGRPSGKSNRLYFIVERICRFTIVPARSVFPGNRAVNQVPLGRYFLFIGGLLLAVLFVAERHWPASAFPAFQTEARFDKSIIRVASSHRWPERILLDTNLVAFDPPPPVPPEDVPVVASAPRDAFAQLAVPAPKVVSEFRAPPAKTTRKSVKRAPVTRVAAYRSPEALPAGW